MPTGIASWRYRYRYKGKTEKLSLGQYPFLDLKEARLRRDEAAMTAFRGESPARQKRLEKVALANASSVKDFCERYFTEVIQKDRKDAAQLRRYLDKEIYPAFGSMSMRDVTAQDVQRLVFRSGTTVSKRLPHNFVICSSASSTRPSSVGSSQSIRARHTDPVHHSCSSAPVRSLQMRSGAISRCFTDRRSVASSSWPPCHPAHACAQV